VIIPHDFHEARRKLNRCLLANQRARARARARREKNVKSLVRSRLALNFPSGAKFFSPSRATFRTFKSRSRANVYRFPPRLALDGKRREKPRRSAFRETIPAARIIPCHHGAGGGGKGGEAEVQIFTAYRACARVPERSSRWARRPLLFVPNVLTFSPSIKKRDRYMRQETAGGGKGRGTGRRRAKERCSERGMRVKGSGGGP
jgi:hypothetical protein